MAAFEALAREYKFLVSADEGTTWVEVGGINTWKWAEETNETSITDFDDAGWEADLPATRKAKLTVEGNHLRDPETGERDAGQIIVETFARKLGFAALLQVRVQTRDEVAGTPPVPFGTITATAFPKLTEKGGGGQDSLTFGAEFSIKGKPTFVGEFAAE